MPPAAPQRSLPSTPVTAAAAASNPPAVRPTAQIAAKPARPFNGFWFYMKEEPGKNKTPSLYPPEFIEATITEQNGMIRGRYRSRYRIVDRAISPDVIFEFAGPASGNSVVAPWTGAGGSKGEITLKIAGENSMKVDWVASDPGKIQGLISGTATLIRRLD